MPRRRTSVLPFDLSLDRHTAHGIVTVIIFALAALLFLSLFNLAGRLGVSIDGAMAQMLGWQRLVLPFFLLAIGIREVSPQRLPLKAANYIGFILFFLSLNPLVDTLGRFGSATTTDLDKFGGQLGALVSEPMLGLVGRAGAAMLLAALFIIALLLIFNTSLRRFVEVVIKILLYFKRNLLVCWKPINWLLAKRAERIETRLRVEILPLASDLPDETLEPANVTERAVGADAAATSLDDASSLTSDSHVHIVTHKPRKRRPRIEIPFELLLRRDQKPTSGDIFYNQNIIQRTLETFGIPVEMGEVSVGPTVTQFTLKPAEGVKLAKITTLHNDLALALAAHPIRMEAPIPGKSLVGIEVPNQHVATVGLREMLETRDWKERRGELGFGLGRDVSGRPWIASLGRMPHLLVAGATGSGKSVCLNALITSLLYAYGPDELKFILIDPKRIELPIYNGLPHLITPVITDAEKTVNALKWTLREMDRRFDLLAKFGARDLASYNTRSEDKLPYVVLIIDELADLMVSAMQAVEGPVVRLAQMSRAVGIHLVLATQRPSVDVITGLIKANIPARIAFAVASSTDSRTILDHTGADKLLGRGDMLLQTADMSSPKRLQGAFVSDEEIGRVVAYLKSAYEPADYDPSVIEQQSNGSTAFGNRYTGENDTDTLLPDAKEEILRAGKASASLLQRRLKVGYARAARMLDLLEQEGFIGPADGAKPRDILKADFSHQTEAASGTERTITNPTLAQVNREIPDIEVER